MLVALMVLVARRGDGGAKETLFQKAKEGSSTMRGAPSFRSCRDMKRERGGAGVPQG